ncbi:MAG: putative acetyltransferase [Methanomassiliicoccales archaeon PtaU1.Bin030]|jgi:ribosomal protein S18 acetylase RimI-like enzyme|nr:MAG: putative acetyltransferase [Methanomassiliicoccales archaeon PtaU1.Bin030]
MFPSEGFIVIGSMQQEVMMKATSREMTRKDLPQVLAISRENMSAIIFSSWGVEYRDEDLLHILLEPTAHNEVLEREGRVVAYFSIDDRNGNLFINSIQVQKACQGRGLGRMMMARIEEHARLRDSPAIELLVQYTNRTAMEFYRRMGYRLICRQGNNYLMRRTLDPNRGPRFVGLSGSDKPLNMQ